MAKDLTGKEFGQWTVLKSSEKPNYSTCRCSCGNIKDVKNTTLLNGKSKSCGHAKGSAGRKRQYDKSNKMINKRYGRLVVVERVNSSGKSKFLCQCDCGNQKIVSVGDLQSGRTLSCGCRKDEQSKERIEEFKEKGHEKLSKNRVENTYLYALTDKPTSRNTTGVRGVSQTKDGRYKARLNFQGKEHYLGLFETLEEAKNARLQAEERYFKPILEKYKDK